MLPTSVDGRSKAQHRADHEALHRLANHHASNDIQADIDRIASAGGGALLLEDKTYTTPPLILPRTPVVRLIGLPGAVIKGDAASFEAGDALVSWAAGAGHVWHQHIEGITLEMPDVAETKAIHYALTDATTWAEMVTQRLQLILRDVQVLCRNDYHAVLVDLEGCMWYGEITNLIGNPAWGDNTYDTLLLRTGTGYPLPNDADYMAYIPDAPGLFACQLRNLHSTWLRGGRSRMFEGRLNLCHWYGGFCDGGSTGPSYWFKDSLASNLIGLACEGREEKPAMWLFENCANMQMQNCSHGAPLNFKTGTFGNGVELRNCRDMQWSGKLASGATAIYSVQSEGKKALVLDEDCRRCTFTNWNIRAVDVVNEMDIQGTNNRVDYVRLHSSVEESGTLSSDYPLSVP